MSRPHATTGLAEAEGTDLTVGIGPDTQFRAYFFGPFCVFRGQLPLGQRGYRRERAFTLLKVFLLDPGRPRSKDELVDLCWPDTPPQKRAGNFHVAIHCLRRMLEPELRPRQQPAYIHRSGPNSYLFVIDQTWWTDTREVQRLFDQGRTCDRWNDARRACFYYGRVAAYGARRFLEDDESSSPWLAPYRRHYEGLYSHALVRLVELHMASGELEEACEYAYQMLRLDPYNELAVAAISEARGTRPRLVHTTSLCRVPRASAERLAQNRHGNFR